MNIGKRSCSLFPVVEIDKEKCVNCHACIMVCPVKYCNDGSGDYVDINHDMCIGCGNCLSRCTHNARYYIDDMDQLLTDLNGGDPVVAIVAPSIASNFKDTYLNINGWLKSLGVDAIFDVSFGAELTVKSYVEHLESNNPQTIIAQPCPAIVTYLELYMPELLTYLAPVDSPMLHTIKMIKEYYPEYKDHKVAVLSPCLAKKREFQEMGQGDYNIAFRTVADYLKNNNLELSSFPAEDYLNPTAERAVLFPTPGGLLKTLERWIPDIASKTRKIEGVHSVYEYLSRLPEAIQDGSAPLIVDCLNCEFGCNSGPLTVKQDISLDSMEHAVVQRKKDNQTDFVGKSDDEIQEEFHEVLSKYWKKDLYKRAYRNLTMNNSIHYPSEIQLKQIYADMHKYTDEDIYDCNACGYETCENMAIAIHHGLNRTGNCHFYMAEEARLAHHEISENEKRLRTILYTVNQGFCLVDTNFSIAIVNPALCTLLGSTKERLVGTNIFESQFKSCLSSERSNVEIRIKAPNGSSKVCLFTPTPYYDENKELVGYFAFLTDISTYRKSSGDTSLVGGSRVS